MTPSHLLTLLALGVCQLLIRPAFSQATTSLADVLAQPILTSLRGAMSQTGIRLEGFTGVLLAPTDAAFAQVAGPVPTATLKNILLYHALTTTKLPTFNASDTATTVGNFSEPVPHANTIAAGWPTLLATFNVTITMANPDVSGVTPYWFFGYANQSAKTTSAQCSKVSTGNTTAATVCLIDRVLTPVPATETIANFLTSQPNLSGATQFALQIPTVKAAWETPDFVTTFFVPTNVAFATFSAKLAAQRNISMSDPSFFTVVANALGGHVGLSVVPFNGSGTMNLDTAFTNKLVADAAGVTSFLPDGTRIGPVPFTNGTRVGKAYIYTVNQMLAAIPGLPSLPSPGLPPSGTSQQLPTPISAPTTSPSTADATSGLSIPAIIGIAVGIAVPALLGVAAVTWCLCRHRIRHHGISMPGPIKGMKDAEASHQEEFDVYVVSSSEIPSDSKLPSTGESGLRSPQPSTASCPTEIKGILVNDVFLRSTAHNYSWTTSNLLQQPTQALEAGINDDAADMALSDSTSCPVVQLTSQELQQQVHLLSDGLLGRGATALVFKCVWPSRFGPNTVLAAKLVKDAYDANVHVLESFMHEATVLASLQHPNIIRMYGYCLEPPTVCLLLELLPMSLKDLLYRGVALPTGTPSTTSTPAQSSTEQGRPLDPIPMHTRIQREGICTSSCMDACRAIPDVQAGLSRLGAAAEGDASADLHMAEQSSDQAQRALTCRQMVCLSKGIAAGLSYMHSNTASDLPLGTAASQTAVAATLSSAEHPQPKDKVVHRDLKPANILINSRGIPKISDFGLARQHEHTSVATIHLGVGTLPYMAPEILVGSQAGVFGQPVTNRVDIYSLGIMLWEMATGSPPWQGMAEMAILAAVTKRQRPPLPPDEESQTSGSLSTLAYQSAMPFAALNAVIRSCWQQRDLKRPQAAEVHDMLSQILAQMEETVVPGHETGGC